MRCGPLLAELHLIISFKLTTPVALTNISVRVSDVIKTLLSKLPLVRGVLSVLGFLLQVKSVGLTRALFMKKSHVIQTGTVYDTGIDPSPTNSCVVDPLGHC